MSGTGAGDNDAFYLSHGQLINGGSPDQSNRAAGINAEELGQALADRAERLRKEGVTPSNLNRDIIVGQHCWSMNFVRTVYGKLPQTAHPIFAGSVEFSQHSKFFKTHPTGAPFFSEVLGIGVPDHTSTFGDVMKNEFKNMYHIRSKGPDGIPFTGDTNPYIIIRDEEGHLMHVTQRAIDADLVS
jgi:hypothetical protein